MHYATLTRVNRISTEIKVTDSSFYKLFAANELKQWRLKENRNSENHWFFKFKFSDVRFHYIYVSDDVYCKNSGDLPKSQKTLLNTIPPLQIFWWKCCTTPSLQTLSLIATTCFILNQQNWSKWTQRVPSVSIWAKIIPHLCLLFMYRQFQKWVLNYFFSTFH